MPNTTQRSGVTFPVDTVTPRLKPFAEGRSHEEFRKRLGVSLESCSDYHTSVVKDIRYQPLLAAVYLAFSRHRPLVLTPDAVWMTIAQGVAQHMTIHGERLRSRFVSHQEKLNLVFTCQGWVDRSPENRWDEAFESWTNQIREHVGSASHDTFICDFSTSGPIERAASQIVMMDIFERYFHYVVYCVCGIPTITLEGTTADWQRLTDKVKTLTAFDLDWWISHLLPICEKFECASRGDVDIEHWRNICKLRDAYGGDIINGWVAKLFPYLRAYINGPCNRINPIFETGEGFKTDVAPSGLSRVPFTFQNSTTRRKRRMEAIGGLFGVTQDPETLALRPMIGWAIHETEAKDLLLERLATSHTTFPGAQCLRQDIEETLNVGWLPPDLCAFYYSTNGADLYGTGEKSLCRIVPIEQFEPLDWGELPEEYGNSRGPEGRIWHRFAWLRDGTWLAINLDMNRRDPRQKDRWSHDELFHAICHGSEATRGKPGQNPVVAVSFKELLERLLRDGPQPYWQQPDFVSHGDADLYTRKD